jgi:hypothetical protein
MRKEYVMKAIGQDVYGPPDVLHLVNADLPGVGDRDVLVRAAGAVDYVHSGQARG